MRRESIPADELMGRRMEIGLIAVLAQLGAKRNWHRIMREWIYGDEPETELGRQEWEYFEARGGQADPAIDSTQVSRLARRSPGPTRAIAATIRKLNWAPETNESRTTSSTLSATEPLKSAKRLLAGVGAGEDAVDHGDVVAGRIQAERVDVGADAVLGTDREQRRRQAEADRRRLRPGTCRRCRRRGSSAPRRACPPPRW